MFSQLDQVRTLSLSPLLFGQPTSLRDFNGVGEVQSDFADLTVTKKAALIKKTERGAVPFTYSVAPLISVGLGVLCAIPSQA